MDILRLTCIEQGIALTDKPSGVTLMVTGQEFRTIYEKELNHQEASVG